MSSRCNQSLAALPVWFDSYVLQCCKGMSLCFCQCKVKKTKNAALTATMCFEDFFEQFQKHLQRRSVTSQENANSVFLLLVKQNIGCNDVPDQTILSRSSADVFELLIWQVTLKMSVINIVLQLLFFVYIINLANFSKL